MEASTPTLSSRPERTRISCHAALDKAACAPFFKERRMVSANATKFHRKSGVAKWRDLLFLSTSIKIGACAWRTALQPFSQHRISTLRSRGIV